MLDITFGEQVKIVLKRKNMTIKELAEIIEKTTGKKMSRQNLTQRLSRDNFQEKDMRLITSILGCEFRLDILQCLDMDDEALQSSLSKIEEKSERNRSRHKSNLDENDGGLTVGDAIDIATKYAASDTEIENDSGDIVELLQDIDQIVSDDEKDGSVDSELAEKKATSRLRDYFARMRSKTDKSFAANQGSKAEKNSSILHMYDDEQDGSIAKEEHTVDIKDSVNTADKKDVEDIDIRRGSLSLRDKEILERAKFDEREDLSKGELNPYTNREYESNSVRTHKKKIGYVQVYDRMIHGWVDMTEWAFLGKEEQKKALLGKEYKPPKYLD
ncbi:MAG: hypothetical protein LBM02_05595 [Lachnospiraceae bacterium]|nr:hypothetical protein [Lachnospiraceae bacterium]